MKRRKKEWTVYVLRCRDGSLYTGVAKDVKARLRQHNAGKGAAYTRSRKPVRLVYTEAGYSVGDALRRELQIKALERARKLALISPPR